ncbi:hypothetical protein PspLS_09304 [Pyricularia sp. CBS 133598]|nr:hypothetical protein PspLS_09304 [Pyricularia sp. CBS 133598]
MDMIRTNLAFALYEELRVMQTSEHPGFPRFRPGQSPSRTILLSVVLPFATKFVRDTQAEELGKFLSAKYRRKLRDLETKHNRAAQKDCERAVEILLSQWPCEVPSFAGFSESLNVNFAGVIEAVRSEWARALSPSHYKDLQPTLRQDPVGPMTHGSSSFTDSVNELERIVEWSVDSRSVVGEKYGQGLLESLRAFRNKKNGEYMHGFQGAVREPDLAASASEVSKAFAAIVSSLAYPDVDLSLLRVKWLQQGLLWPIITPSSVLQQVSSLNKHCQFGSNMKEAIIHFGPTITAFQRQRRLEMLSRKHGSEHQFDRVRFNEERANKGHINWKLEDYPDWLLLEIESELFIRPDKIDVALATISPRRGMNSVVQMNMGQGKTSCIIPMVAAILSTNALTRVIVPKALLHQTAQLLQTRLGGLLNRELVHVPFSRRNSTVEANIKAYGALHRDTLAKAGVMICLPEHPPSFALSGLQRLLDNKVQEADLVVNTQAWLKSVSRDVMDESDYTLAVRTQLIYPSGPQITIDGHPHRWQVAEKLFKLVHLHLHSLKGELPNSIDVVTRPSGGFPLIYFLRKDVEDELTAWLNVDICKGIGDILLVSSLDSQDRMHIRRLISNAKVTEETAAHLAKMCADKMNVRQTVYLLRSLLINRILLMCLKKKWNFQYGLHPGRDPIAVPFYAKGVPSDQSEWGHQDIAILFTCLAFYYTGVNPTQLSQALKHLLNAPAQVQPFFSEFTDRD